MNYAELNRLIDESGLKRSYIAKKLGWSNTKFHNRTKTESKWSGREMKDFCEFFNLSRKQSADIFLP